MAVYEERKKPIFEKIDLIKSNRSQKKGLSKVLTSIPDKLKIRRLTRKLKPFIEMQDIITNADFTITDIAHILEKKDESQMEKDFSKLYDLGISSDTINNIMQKINLALESKSNKDKKCLNDFIKKVPTQPDKTYIPYNVACNSHFRNDDSYHDPMSVNAEFAREYMRASCQQALSLLAQHKCSTLINPIDESTTKKDKTAIHYPPEYWTLVEYSKHTPFDTKSSLIKNNLIHTTMYEEQLSTVDSIMSPLYSINTRKSRKALAELKSLKKSIGMNLEKCRQEFRDNNYGRTISDYAKRNMEVQRQTLQSSNSRPSPILANKVETKTNVPYNNGNEDGR